MEFNFLRVLLGEQPKFGSLSINQLQESHYALSRQKKSLVDPLPSNYNIHQVNVISPFYERISCSKTGCGCPYHKRLRENRTRQKQNRLRATFTKPAEHHSLHHNVQMPKQLGKSFNKRRTFAEIRSKGMRHSYSCDTSQKKDFYNQDFEEFIKKHQQFWRRKSQLAGKPDHIVKSSVEEIFKYIYTHIDSQKDQIEEYVQNVEKDRDISFFYIDRFMEIKDKVLLRRKMRVKEEEPESTINKLKLSSFHTNKLKKVRANLPKKEPEVKEKTPRASTSNQQLHKPKKHKKEKRNPSYLLMKAIVQDLMNDKELKEQNLQELAQMRLKQYSSNFNHLKEQIQSSKFSNPLLCELNSNLLNRIRSILDANSRFEQNDITDFTERTEKENILNGIEEIIQEKLEESRLESLDEPAIIIPANNINADEDSDYEEGVGINFNMATTKKKNLQKKKKSANIDDNDNQNSTTKNEKIQQEEYKSTQKIQYMSRDLRQRVVRNKKHQFAHKKEEEEEEAQKNKRVVIDHMNINLNLDQKQKRISDLQHVMRMDGDEDFKLTYLKKMFIPKMSRLKQLEKILIQQDLQHLIVQENDCLITVKRKMSIFKGLLTCSVILTDLRGNITEYLKIIDEQNYIKNRNWARYKLRQGVQLDKKERQKAEIKTEQDDIQKLIQTIENTCLSNILYQVQKTIYDQKQIMIKFCDLAPAKVENLPDQTNKRLAIEGNYLAIPKREEMLTQKGLQFRKNYFQQTQKNLVVSKDCFGKNMTSIILNKKKQVSHSKSKHKNNSKHRNFD